MRKKRLGKHQFTVSSDLSSPRPRESVRLNVGGENETVQNVIQQLVQKPSIVQSRGCLSIRVVLTVSRPKDYRNSRSNARRPTLLFRIFKYYQK